MNIVRLKPRDSSKVGKLTIIFIVLIAIVLIILLFNPINNVRTMYLEKKEQSLNKTPAYEDLKDVKLIDRNGKYNIPVVGGIATVNSKNLVKIEASSGSVVRSIDNGIINEVGLNNIYGNYVEISYSKINVEEFYVLYGNLDCMIGDDVIPVQEGQKIGKVGNSGYVIIEFRDKNHNITSPYKYMNLN